MPGSDRSPPHPGADPLASDFAKGATAPAEAPGGVGEGTAACPAHAFSPGEVLAGRYRVERFIARGGMGEVYQAADLELNQDVALKVIRPSIARDLSTLRRFKREILLARKVSHPNVCRVFDLGVHQRHRGGDSQEERVPFLTMELLSGETLGDRIRRGPLGLEEALPLIQQMTAALQAAHDGGVVHRDFKSENVFLVPSPGDEGPCRAVVTDFGLAREEPDQDGGGASQSLRGVVFGTPAYMAPEQVTGRPASPAADLYALGIVIYEMVTGTLPFIGDPYAVAALRLREPPPPPRRYRPDLDPRWEAVILRCLRLRPEERYVSAQEVASALSVPSLAAGATAEDDGAHRTSRIRRRPRLILAGLLVPVVLGLGLSWLLPEPLWRGTPKAARPAGAARQSVAVLGFRSITGAPDTAWIGAGLSEMLWTELGAAGKLRMIPGENVARMKRDLVLAQTDGLARDTLGRIRAHLSADVVVMGSYVSLEKAKDLDGELRLDLRVQDAATGETLLVLSETSPMRAITQLVARTGARIMERLGCVSARGPAATSSLSANPAAIRLYSEGVGKLEALDFPAARQMLTQAVAADAQDPMAHWALARLWQALGYEDREREEAERAFALSGRLRGVARLRVEAHHHAVQRNLARVVETYRTLSELFPDDIEYGLALAKALVDAGQPAQALDTVQRLHQASGLTAEDPRIDLAQSLACRRLSSFNDAIASAQRAAQKAGAVSARYLLAQARQEEGESRYSLGDVPQAVTLWEEARRLYEALGHRQGLAAVSELLGGARARQGDLAGSVRARQEAIGTLRELGSQRRLIESLGTLAMTHLLLGDLPLARTHAEEALVLARQAGQPTDLARAQWRVGTLLLSEGRPVAARKAIEEAIAVFGERGDRRQLGELWRSLGKCLHAEGDLDGARARLVAALALQQELGLRLALIGSRRALAALALEEGSYTEAETLARESAEALRNGEERDDEAQARAVLAHALLAQGKTGEAQTEALRAQALVGHTENVPARLAAMLVAGRVRLANSREGPAARVLLLEVLGDAKRMGFLREQLEARLLLSGTERTPAARRARLRTIEHDARGAGLASLARQAASLRQR